MNRVAVTGIVSLLVLAGMGAVSAQQTTSPPAAAPAQGAEPAPPADKSPPLAGPETGTRHPSAGGPETGYHGSNDPKSSTGANLPGENVPPDAATGAGSGQDKPSPAPTR
jgi:hypothetical protein